MTQLKQSLGELTFLFNRGKRTFQSYQQNEQSFLYARILKNNNDRIKAILFQVSHLLPQELMSHCLDLMHHLDVWSELWIDLFNRLTPKLNEQFIFNNNVNYPLEAEIALTKFYKTI